MNLRVVGHEHVYRIHLAHVMDSVADIFNAKNRGSTEGLLARQWLCSWKVQCSDKRKMKRGKKEWRWMWINGRKWDL